MSEPSCPPPAAAAPAGASPACQYCLADPRYTTIAPPPATRCPVCGSSYSGPRRDAQYRALVDAGLIIVGD